MEFLTSPATAIESLISINNKLQQTGSAHGILKYAQRYQPELIKESWYEKLHRWEGKES